MDLITREQLLDWLCTLMGNRTVIGPTQAAPDLVLYRAVRSPADMVMVAPRTRVSPKEFFLPATEAILTIERIKQRASGDGDGAGSAHWDVRLTESKMERDQVLFGIRPCDVHALAVLDALLLREPVDSYYAERRERTTLVGLACEQMGPACFCTSLRSSPDDSTGMDVMLYPFSGGYALDVVTEKGKALTEGLSRGASAGENVKREWPAPTWPVLPPSSWAGRFNDPYWGRLADRCLSCKICSYICPTCRCFDVRDYTTAEKPGYQRIQRLRCWDSCMAEGYRRIAGGHNPRPTKAQRLRNRFYCKFDYYPADFGPVACVGCGRCVELCPVNVDVTEVLQTMAAGS